MVMICPGVRCRPEAASATEAADSASVTRTASAQRGEILLSRSIRV